MDYKPSPATERILKRAQLEAESSGKSEIEGTHLLVAILQDGKTPGAMFLAQKQITVEELRTIDFQK